VRTFHLDQRDLLRVRPLVVGVSLGPTDTAAMHRDLFRGRTEKDWYFVGAVGRGAAGTEDVVVMPFHFINHGALQFLNRGRTGEWSVPLVLCQTYADIVGQSAFSVYREQLHVQEDSDSPCILEEAFDTRLHLSKWLRSSVSFQQQHPLSARQWQFAGVGVGSKRIDNIVYHFLAAALKEVPATARARWVKCESQLLLFKLLLRPQLHAHILHIVGRA